MSCTCIAPINIAIIKYWGKRDIEENLPLHSSLSITLDTDSLFTITKVKTLPYSNHVSNRFTLNETYGYSLIIRELEIKEGSRIYKVLDRAHQYGLDCPISIESSNSFPVSAGLASSASGFAALSLCLGKLGGFDFKKTCSLARIGSGSSCRSLLGGFVEWISENSNPPIEHISKQIFPHTHWPDLRIVVIEVSASSKSVGSSEGMQRSVLTSEYLKLKVQSNIVPERMTILKKAIQEHDFKTFCEIAMKESNSLHAICLDTYPPIEPPYLNTTSHRIIKFVHSLNTFYNRILCGYTFDAGPNAFVFLQKADLQLFFINFFSVFNYQLSKCHQISRLLENVNIDHDKIFNNLKMHPNNSDVINAVYLCKVGSDPTFVDENNGGQ